jgi:hypothetical protein
MSAPFQFSNPQPPFQPGPPSPPAKKRPWITSKPFLVIAALIVGLVLGTNGAGGSAKPAAPVTVAGAAITQQVTTTATATVTKATVPAVCLTALADADAVIQVVQDVLTIVADEFDAISRMDVAAMEADNTKIKGKTAEVQTIPYAADSAACRAVK